jgi:DNA-binding response OmpR family regulator
MEIIVIDDNLKQSSPLIVALGMSYQDENIKLFNKSSDGLEYVKNNLSKKLIVILDIGFGLGEINGREVLSEIRKHNKLIPVIIWSAVDIVGDDFLDFINNHALFYEKKTAPYKKIIARVKDAEHRLSLDVSTAIENWLYMQEDKDKVIMVSGNKEPFTANKIIEMIRSETEEGQKIEKSILNLTISLLFRKKERI